MDSRRLTLRHTVSCYYPTLQFIFDTNSEIMRKLNSILGEIGLTSCHFWDINCGKDLLKIEKKYNELAEKVHGDDEQLKEIYRAKAHEIEKLECY